MKAYSDLGGKKLYYKLTPLVWADRRKLFAEIGDALPEIWQDKIWEMIWNRWRYYEDFCNQG